MQEEKTIPQMVDDVRAGKMDRRNFMKTLTVMGISAAGVGAIAGAIARPFISRPAPVVDADEATQLKLHDQHIANQTEGNRDALHNDYAHNAVVEDSMHNEPFVGRDAIMARKSAGMAAIPDLKITVTNRIVRGNELTVEWVAAGTHTADLPGLPASGRSFSIPGVTVVVRRDNRIVRESIYYDLAEVHQQLGPGKGEYIL